MRNDTDWMEFGLFDSKKLGRLVPFYNVQQERFLQLSEDCMWIDRKPSANPVLHNL